MKYSRVGWVVRGSCWALAALAGCMTAAECAETPRIPLAKGLVLTTTTHAGLNANGATLAVADVETVYSVDGVAADKVVFAYRIAAPNDPKAAAMLRKSPRFTRVVRTEDLRTSNRLNALFSSTDPELFAGQTFLQTSTAVLTALKAAGETPFVFGINESSGALGGLASMLGAAPRPAAGGADTAQPLDVSGLLSSLATARHYYRGTLKRVEPGAVKFSVLLNGVRTEVPAIHARGQLKFSTQQLEADFWWLDDAANPLTLRWSANTTTYAVLTRIDTPEPEATAAAAAGGSVAARLADRSCRAELHGLYFETGSAELLEESAPALRQVAAALSANPGWQVTVEGHTDNIGSAAYNNELSLRRANAVRTALISRYRVGANRIAAQGFGLSKPIESNTTPEGRAHNRRVELARKCP
jgi:outer membrane protein OmpA-like peptidoglycan-associated protein